MLLLAPPWPTEVYLRAPERRNTHACDDLDAFPVFVCYFPLVPRWESAAAAAAGLLQRWARLCPNHVTL